MAVLDRLPSWATTGVGSLPYTDGRIAVARAVRDYDLPFCPQLPRLEGDMIAEWLGGDPGRCGWSPERDRERPHAWYWLLRELGLGPPAHRVVKLQVTGPLTLACALERSGGHGLGDHGLRTEIAIWLAANVAGQLAALRERGLDALVIADEPMLDTVAHTRRIEHSWDPLRALGVPWGLHLLLGSVARGRARGARRPVVRPCARTGGAPRLGGAAPPAGTRRARGLGRRAGASRGARDRHGRPTRGRTHRLRRGGRTIPPDPLVWDGP